MFMLLLLQLSWRMCYSLHLPWAIYNASCTGGCHWRLTPLTECALSPSLSLFLFLCLCPSLTLTRSTSLFRSLASLPPPLSLSLSHLALGFFLHIAASQVRQNSLYSSETQMQWSTWVKWEIAINRCPANKPGKKKIAPCYHFTLQSRYLRAASTSLLNLGHKKIVRALKVAQCSSIKLLELKNVLLNISRV